MNNTISDTWDRAQFSSQIAAQPILAWSYEVYPKANTSSSISNNPPLIELGLTELEAQALAMIGPWEPSVHQHYRRVIGVGLQHRVGLSFDVQRVHLVCLQFIL